MNKTQSINQTVEEARARMDNARTESLAGDPSLDYLSTLEHEIRDWLRAVTEERIRVGARLR